MNAGDFHFLRPAWLWALALLPALLWAWRRARVSSGWERVCEPHLLRHLLGTEDRGGQRLGGAAAFALAWLGGCLALAGPTWERLPQPAFEDNARTVFVLGLAPTMGQSDVAPSRIARARHKLTDALDRLPGGSAALVLYREEGFVAVPLTDDFQVLREIVPLLEPDLAPGRGAFPSRGIEAALEVLKPVGVAGAEILLLSDGADDAPQASQSAVHAAARAGARVSVLGVAGPSESLAALADAGGGRFAPLRADDRDLTGLLGVRDVNRAAAFRDLAPSAARTDTWRDQGVWLVWIPLVVAPLAFRKGWATAALALLAFSLPAPTAQAAWTDWFERPDQRGAREFAAEDFAASAESFENPAWEAAAHYRAGDYAAAAQTLADRDDPHSHYNRGNALAKAGQLEEALVAYESALAAHPDDDDAQFNRNLVKRLLEQQPPPNPTDSGSSDAEGSADSNSNAERGSDSGNVGEHSSDAASDVTSGASSESAGADAAEVPQAGSDPVAAETPPAEADPASRPEGGSSESTDSELAPDDRAHSGDASSKPETRNASGTGSDSIEQHEPPGSDPPESARAGRELPPHGTSAGSSSDGAGERERGAPSAPVGRAPASPRARAHDQEMARWMARLPDDPGGLLREKMRRDYQRKQELRGSLR